MKQHSKGEAACLGWADLNIREEDEVLHTYGLLGNAALLQTYGFVEERFYVMGLECGEGAFPHPYDFVRLPVDLLYQVFSRESHALCMHGTWICTAGVFVFQMHASLPRCTIGDVMSLMTGWEIPVNVVPLLTGVPDALSRGSPGR